MIQHVSTQQDTQAAQGERLMALHIGYETIEPWPLARVETPSRRAEGSPPKPVLKSRPPDDPQDTNMATGTIALDADT